MKKLFSLLLCAGLFSSAFAQTDRERGRDVILGKPSSKTSKTTTSPRDVILGGNGSSTSSSNSGCQAQIDGINRNYDNQVRAIQSNPLISAADKAEKIRQTNEARRNKINEVRRTCGTRNTHYGHHDNDRTTVKKNKVKGNNGNHYGWEKGKGNPHRNGGKHGKGNKGKR